MIFLAIFAGYILFLDADASKRGISIPPWWQQCLIIFGGPSFLVGLWLLVRWPFQSRRNFGLALVGLAIFATLVAIFYLEEDWRGKRDWLQCKAELEAKGAVLDWDKYLPPTVPDDQNFFMVNTNFYLRFVRLQTEEQREAAKKLAWLNLSLSASNSFPILDFAKSKPLVVAELTVVAAAADAGAKMKNATAIQLRDPAASQQLQGIILKTIGHCANGSQGYQFSELQLSNLAPAKVFVQADTLLTKDDFKNMVPANLVTNLGQLAVEPTAVPGVFQIKFVSGKITSAADYLRWSDQFEPAFDEIREALKRPYAIVPGDYSQTYLMPIPNFVMMRSLAQTLAQRTQCHLLLGEPDQALREFTLMHDVCRILEKPPSGQPETLVEAMINVAITGLYVSTVADGFKWQAWREPQIAAIQSQLKSVNLYTPVVNGFKMEQAGSAHTLITLPASKLRELFNLTVVTSGKKPSHFWKDLTDPTRWLLWLTPRGWLYQNIVVSARLQQRSLAAFDVANSQVQPHTFDRATRDIEKALKHRTAFNVWSAIAIPNFTKAAQTMAYNQTLANEGQVACALDRFKLANQSYPAALDELVPQYLEKIPSDLIGGEPLRYRRTDDGKFVLYSVGWNETDDGGKDSIDRAKADWVWKQE
jgi:hypothetical protein